MGKRTYLIIDLKSFYASVECVARGLDPMTAKLVVADPERTDKTICLAVSPAMKALGVKNRCRVFEIPKHIEYIMAPPRMRLYIECAAEIYGIYLQFVSKNDIHVYSVDEAFLDVTEYLGLYHMTARQLAMTIMEEIRKKLGVRATCGVGTNLYLAKIALDITAKHAEDFVGELDEASYRELLWDHRPLTDFWRIGPGTARRLESRGIFTMGGIARADEDMLYRLFGVDAELLIDHAWGREPTTMADIKAYRAKTNCLSRGQVLMQDYSFREGETIVKEMTDLLCLDLVEKEMITPSLTLYVGYSNALHLPAAKGTVKLDVPSSSDKVLVPAAAALYGRIVDPQYPVRRISITCNQVVADDGASQQMSMFEEQGTARRDKRLQQTVLDIKKKYGKNSILKGLNYTPEATTRERNLQIGGHKSGDEA